MKAVILAGGRGTRLEEETVTKPKPMVEIGGKPIIWHIMKIYSAYGINDFIICCGYRGYMIKEYFAHYHLHMSDVTIDMRKNCTEVHHETVEPWRVTLVNTGHETQTGGRLKRVASYLNDEDFCFTYGDGLSNLNISELVRFHEQQGTLATLTAVTVPGRFGSFELDGRRVTRFQEKPKDQSSLINGGFFVLSAKVLDYIEGDETVWERGPLEKLSRDGELSAFVHSGFWQCMDTLRDLLHLQDLWESGKAPWKVW